MVGMTGNRAVWTKRQHDVRLQLAHMQHQVGHYPMQVCPVQLAVHVIEHNSAINAQDFTRRRKLLTPHRRQFVVRFRGAPVRCRLPRCQADDEDLAPAIVIEA